MNHAMKENWIYHFYSDTFSNQTPTCILHLSVSRLRHQLPWCYGNRPLVSLKTSCRKSPHHLKISLQLLLVAMFKWLLVESTSHNAKGPGTVMVVVLPTSRILSLRLTQFLLFPRPIIAVLLMLMMTMLWSYDVRLFFALCHSLPSFFLKFSIFPRFVLYVVLFVRSFVFSFVFWSQTCCKNIQAWFNLKLLNLCWIMFEYFLKISTLPKLNLL